MEGSNAARAQAHRDSDEIRTFRVGRDGGLMRRAAMRLT
jgi:hypothetical protein